MKTHRLARLISTALLCALACAGCSDGDDGEGWSPQERVDGGHDAGDVDAAHCEADTGPPPDSCEPGQYQYEDTLCSPPPGDQCEPYGDGRCYDLCETDADCTDSCRPYCRTLGLFAGGDWGCNEWRYVCQSTTFDECGGL